MPTIHRTYKGDKDTPPDHDYTRIDNRIIDGNLSPLAKLAMVYLLSKSDDWELRTDNLRRYLEVGRNKTEQVIRELKLAGHLDRRQTHNSDGVKGFTTLPATIYEAAQPELAAAYQQAAENSTNGRAALNVNISVNFCTPISGEQISGEQKSGEQKPGDIVTTDLKTTDFNNNGCSNNGQENADFAEMAGTPSFLPVKKLILKKQLLSVGQSLNILNDVVDLFIEHDQIVQDDASFNDVVYAIAEISDKTSVRFPLKLIAAILEEIRNEGGLENHCIGKEGALNKYSYELAMSIMADDEQDLYEFLNDSNRKLAQWQRTKELYGG